MNTAKNKILVKMLERLLNSLMNGPSLNCRPHASRQRIDWTQLAKLRDLSPEAALAGLLSGARKVEIKACVAAPSRVTDPWSSPGQGPGEEAEDDPGTKAWNEQRACMNKLRTIVEDSKTYEQDTGVHVLNIGYPLLSLPPGSLGPLAQNSTRRILAPIAFIPVNVTVKAGVAPSIEIACASDGIDLVVPNLALMAWVEQQLGKAPEGLYADDQGEDPWREIQELVDHVKDALRLTNAGVVIPLTQNPDDGGFSIRSSPRRDNDSNEPQIVPAAVLGLFPLTNQGLIRDMQDLVAGEDVTGPIESFISVDATLELGRESRDKHEDQPKFKRVFAEERLVTTADPCQARAVKLSRTSRGLVVHGPPGTGKSQTITNMIGDHLARGERVLVVCDKRTALDVVLNRLESSGLGELCAVVHDPQRDQAHLYKSIREQLERLADSDLHPRMGGMLDKADAELQSLHGALASYESALTRVGGSGASFHDSVGTWLAIDEPLPDGELGESLSGVKSEELETHIASIREILDRGGAANYPKNRWVSAAGLTLAQLLSESMDANRKRLGMCVDAAKKADATLVEGMPPFGLEPSLIEQASHRLELADRLERVNENVREEHRKHWATSRPNTVSAGRQQLASASSSVSTFREGPLDAELVAAIESATPTVTKANSDLAALEAYLAIAGKWYSFIKGGIKKAATGVLTPFGLGLSEANAVRVKGFLIKLKSRILLSDLYRNLTGAPTDDRLVPDEQIARAVTDHELLFDLLDLVNSKATLKSLIAIVQKALVEPRICKALIKVLRRCKARAEAVEQLKLVLAGSRLFDRKWLAFVESKVVQGAVLTSVLESLQSSLTTLENVLRVREGLAKLPQTLRGVIERLLKAEIASAPGERILLKSAIANGLSERIIQEENLRMMDSQRLKSCFERYSELVDAKPRNVQRQILHLWRSRQKDRLLAGTGARMNSDGAEVRRRLVLRGRKAMRLRQVIALGESIDGGDPLFDLRPVWMASPETVAQLFRRRATFDVVIFDEASQCRLEEALPVLTRAHRVVVAGDPKQLPPTRFFESAVAASEDDEVETAQDLFETQQSDVEDLLTAALNLDIQECYLDVHYRSRNSDLIQFSNEQFYESRLQPIPGHPANRTRYAPITLYSVNGTYEKRSNLKEADEVCRIVRDLLKRANPPSIGIACFNISQRDLITERLDYHAEQDADFARRLDQARQRVDRGAPANLFVKNLENVQGDERDHIIVSTTYGPDEKGRFYQRFGPVGRVGGGRRLNVLVTRAREELHLVTSIPATNYRNLPQIPSGQTPSGAWLLYAYLRFAEVLKELYEQAHARYLEAQATGEAVVTRVATRRPSMMTESMGESLAAKYKSGNTIYWGNDGFCVDIALQHPRNPEDVTIGLLCDFTRYEAADDPIEWEVFRTSILEMQGWKLHRVWTPHFFRDPNRHLEDIQAAVRDFLDNEKDPEVLEVQPST